MNYSTKHVVVKFFSKRIRVLIKIKISIEWHNNNKNMVEIVMCQNLFIFSCQRHFYIIPIITNVLGTISEG